MERRRLQEEAVAFQYLKGAYKEGEDVILSRTCCGRKRSAAFKLKEGRFRIDAIKTFFL